ncbi:ComF family protein [Sphingobacterium psychroaquaticum]|uniref:ComF family protein n=1 Tax=Sphingobacterium psychroaquaticum TaxID=561061 RepID=UPI00106D4E42|nr:phosphoribosyltransferase family protein [Sphingobacterium psychroaquaticum]QBQ42835.1 ComF family protein [Sphingobacterium psychroaquaticum]
MPITNYWKSFLAILFPPLCIACEDVLLYQERLLCITCLFHLPVNDHYLFQENEITRRLLGKMELHSGMAYFSFAKSSFVQEIVHKMKYRGRQDIGLHFGQLIGKQLQQSTSLPPLDLIVPIPLHRKKMKARGYNQSDALADGIAKVLSVDVDKHLLERVRNSPSQTKMKRIDRDENVEGAFICRSTNKLTGKHILLVDDVVTTGATIAAAAQAIQDVADCKLSVAVLAQA